VTEPGYDDIGKVLDRLWIPFEEIKVRGFGDWDVLEKYNVVFVNCSWHADGEHRWKPHRQNVIDFVSRGGCIYASDLSASLIKVAFPSMLDFGGGLPSGTYNADVVDEGLAAVVGPQVQVQYNRVATSVKSFARGVHVYVRTATGETKRSDEMVTSFPHAAGDVVFTTFHNHKQTSEGEDELLKFLVLRPLMGSTARASVEKLKTSGFERRTQVIGRSSARKEKVFVYHAAQGDSIRFYLDWKDENQLSLSVFSPSGDHVKEVSGWTSPLFVDVKASKGGDWTYSVKSLIGKEAPYVASVGTAPDMAPGPPGVPAGPKFCKHCGGSVSPSAAFCGKCGQPIRKS
jgi:hypothetical protein